MYQIDHNIPIPDRSRAPRKSKYPLLELEVGDSFAIPPDRVCTVRVYINKVSRATSRRFTCLAQFCPESPTKVYGYRIWRIS